MKGWFDVKRKMVRVPETALPWLGVSAFGWGNGWVYPAPAPARPKPVAVVQVGAGVPGTIGVSTVDELRAAVAAARAGTGPMAIRLPREI